MVGADCMQPWLSSSAAQNGQDAEFSDNEMMDVIDIFTADQDIAKVDATLQTSRACTTLVQHHLAKMQEGSL